MTPNSSDSVPLTDDPLWFKDAIIYELHVKTFFDGNSDGIGDFNGVLQKLDYLQDLGVTALWILPFYPSPLRDDGYDISDYYRVHPSYGSLRDFKRLMKEAHRRGMRVITELVINHTSDQHPWFQRARRAPAGGRFRKYYVWSDDPSQYEGTRIIFKDFEPSNWTWDPVAGQYYWHRFYAHQPDLNFDNPEVQNEIFKILDYWLEMGVDGLRLDAIPYLYERDGTNCENLGETHAFLKQLRARIDAKYKNRMLLAEANQWPEDAAAYFGDGDECHMNFHFPLMPRMFMALQLENNFPIIDILDQTPHIPENCQWAVFLRNHDELTLEMVTDEDRDYMYRVYAADPRARINLGIRRRLAPLMQTRRRVELMNGLLFSMPGTPVVYYGDEIGMGDNIYLGDRDGVRTPMQWSGDRNAGFSKANPQKLYLPTILDPEYHFESVNVEAQQSNPNSLLWWMKHIIALRKEHQVFGRGDICFLETENPKVLAFTRTHEGESVLVVANLSRFAQYTELSLGEYEGMVPVELLGSTEFPPIGELPYLLTMSPHTFHWFLLRSPAEDDGGRIPSIELRGHWERLLAGRGKSALGKVLPSYLQHRRWFRSKTREIKDCTVTDAVSVRTEDGPVQIAFVRVSYSTGPSETYVLPLTLAAGERAMQMLQEPHPTVIARQKESSPPGEELVLCDAFGSPALSRALLSLFVRRRALPGHGGEIRSTSSKEGRECARSDRLNLEPWLLSGEQTNSSVVYGDQLVFKLFRMVEDGKNPDLELGEFLTRRSTFRNTPTALGALEYHHAQLEHPATLGTLTRFVANQGDAWAYTIDALGRFYDRALTLDKSILRARTLPGWIAYTKSDDAETWDEVQEAVGPYLMFARQLAETTADLHLSLASEPDDEDFRPEPFSELHQRSLYQSARGRMRQTLKVLRRNKCREALDGEIRDLATAIGGQEDEIDRRLRRVFKERIEASRVRVHGDYHLGQVLYTGKDFVIIDFEGEPARPLSERRFKRSPLVDVAGMLRSFHYASVASLSGGNIRAEDMPELLPWADAWTTQVSRAFVSAYFERTSGAVFSPPDLEQRHLLLEFYVLDKCLYELDYEMNHRPKWVAIPLRGLQHLLDL